jgi:hypothetical protein
MSEESAGAETPSTESAQPTSPSTESSFESTEVSSSSESTENQQQETPNTPTDKTEEPSPPELHEVNINGSTRKVSLDDLKAKYSLESASRERFEEAAKLNKQASTIMNLLKNDPMKLLTHPDLGLNFKELAENYLIGELEKEQMSPEQRSVMDRDNALQQREQELQRREQEIQNQRLAAQEEIFKQKFDKDIAQALIEAGMPKNAQTMMRVVDVLKRLNSADTDIPIKDVVLHVKQEMTNELQSLLGTMDPISLTSLLGEDITKSIRSAEIDKLVKKPAHTVQDTPVTPPAGNRRNDKDIDAGDFFRNL